MKKVLPWRIVWDVYNTAQFGYFAFRCWLGRPVTYRDYQDGGDWWYANCKNCNRQTEVHFFGGPDFRSWIWKSWRSEPHASRSKQGLR